MKTLRFSIHIQALREKVWHVLWNDETYRQWTAAFQEGSHAVSDWEEGSKILFLSPEGNGMVAFIDKKIPQEQMVFRHVGEITNGEEKAGTWGEEAFERYYLTENNGTTALIVELDTIEEYEQMFSDMFPKALQVVKNIAESNVVHQ